MELIKDQYEKVYDELKDKTSWEYIDPMGMSASSIEQLYQTMLLDVMGKVKDDYIEKRLHIAPSMVGCFYYYLFFHRKIPDQAQYIRFFYRINEQWVREYIGREYHQAFLGRLSRFYPSMLRDVHFYHLLKDAQAFDRVLFTLKNDLEAKIDILLEKEHQWYGIQLRTMTRRSDQFYEKKKFRNMVETDAILIDLPIDLSNARDVPTKKDTIKLYDERHIHQILEEIESKKNIKGVS